MLIKYEPENISLQYNDIDNAEDDQTQFIPTFTVEDIAIDDTYCYSKVFGSIDDFISMNDQFEEVQSIPDGVTYLADKSFGTPSDINTFFKIRTRERINSEVGDIWDLIADMSKRITMSERLITLLSLEIIENQPDLIPKTKTKYEDLLQQYRAILINSEEMDIADLEDPIELFAKLLDRSIKITNIVKEDYINFKE